MVEPTPNIAFKKGFAAGMDWTIDVVLTANSIGSRVVSVLNRKTDMRLVVQGVRRR
jgi:hypothetical protein